MRLSLAWLVLILAAVTPQWVQGQGYPYPAWPFVLPYYPPMNYGPGNHLPRPFQGYPGHPQSGLFFPYLFTPYSAYYHYPTYTPYRDAYNPLYPGFGVWRGWPPIVPPGGELLPPPQRRFPR